jgi:hypothetical protein
LYTNGVRALQRLSSPGLRRRLADAPISSHNSSFQRRFERLVGSTFLIMITALGLCSLLDWMTRLLLHSTRTKRLWAKHMHARGREPIWLWALGVVAFAAVGVLTAPSALADVVGIQIESPVELFLGALAPPPLAAS